MSPVILNFPIRDGVNVEGEYEGFIRDLRETLANHPDRENYIIQYGAWLREHPLLAVQRPIQPYRWIHINLIVQDEDGAEETRITIAVRDDNVYLMGFKNRHDKWYEFGFEERRSARFIAGSTFLGCDVGYPRLIGGAANLMSLSLTKYDVIRAIRRLSGYQQAGPANGETVHHLARLCIIICECARMIPHHAAVSAGWNGNDQIGISLEQAENIKDWSKMSRELLRDPNPLDNSYIQVVHLVRNTAESRSQQQDRRRQAGVGGGSRHHGAGSSEPQMSSSSGTASSGGSSGPTQQKQGLTAGKTVRTRPLLAVFEVIVEGNFRDNIGTVVVFDGKRGQIIYKHGVISRLFFWNFNGLPLTGPYKAISAEGSVAILVYDRTSRTDNPNESSNVIGEVLLDCCTDSVEYDKVLTGDIIISTGTGRQERIATVEYAVWSDAVEATVEVSLLLPVGITRFFGKQNDLVDEEEIFGSLGGSINFYLDRHTGEIRVTQYGDSFVPTGGSDSVAGGGTSSASGEGTEQTSLQKVKVQVNITSPGFHVPEPHSFRHMGIKF